MPRIDAERTHIDEYDDRHVDEGISKGIHEGADAAYKLLTFRQLPVAAGKQLLFVLLLAKRAEGSGARQIFAGREQNFIQLRLRFFIERHAHEHDRKHDGGKDGNRARKHESRSRVDEKRHDHGSEYDEGRTQKETQNHIDSRLQLIDVVGHSRQHGRSTQLIHIRITQGLQFSEQRLSHLSGHARGGLCGKILRRYRTGQSDQPERAKHEAHGNDIGTIRVRVSAVHVCPQALIDDQRDDDGHDQFKRRFQKFEQRAENALYLIWLEIG